MKSVDKHSYLATFTFAAADTSLDYPEWSHEYKLQEEPKIRGTSTPEEHKMLLSETESKLLKQWIIKKLKDISDADSDVLADYVLALVNTEDSDPVAKAACVANLKDFVPNGTDRFVDELFQAIATKSYDPSRPPLRPTAPTYQPFKGFKATPPGPANQSKKRAHWEREEQTNGDTKPLEFDFGSRPIKQAKRGGRGRGREQRGGRPALMHPLPPAPRFQQPEFPAQPQTQFPAMIPEIPPFDPANPMQGFVAMAQALEAFYNNQNGAAPALQRCPNMENYGACADGLSCPYDHSNGNWDQEGGDVEYDPANAVFPDIKPSRVGELDMSDRQRGRGRGRGSARAGGNWRGGGKRSEFAHLGVNHDKSVTTIVVESIPDENCNEEHVRGFFSGFGTIEEATIEPEQSLALVKFADRAAAQAAYHSPKVVFDNRFVKVYMKKSEMFPTAPNGHGYLNGEPAADHDVEMGDDDSFDVEAFAKRQEEAQRKHEEMIRQREDAAKQRHEVNARLFEMELERRKLEALLLEKGGDRGAPLENGSIEEPEQTKALKAQLAQLEAEAKILGIDPDAASINGFSDVYSNDFSNGYSAVRGRGGYRGRGRGRGRGRAQYRGYGAWGGASGGVGAVMRLDNRPKTVAVMFATGTYDDQVEALRQFLLFNSMDTATISKHPEREDSALVSFQQRFEGESFASAAVNSELPHIGKVEMSWYPPVGNVPVINGHHELAEDPVMVPGAADPTSNLMAEEDVPEEDLDRWS